MMWIVRVLCLVLCLVVGVFAQEQRRPNAEIAADLDKLSAELRLPPVVVVEAGADLQSILNAATAGSTLTLADGAIFAGSYVAPKPVRIVATSATIRASGTGPALLVAGDDVEILGVAFDTTATNNDTLLQIKRGSRNAILRNVRVTGNGSTKRGIGAQGTGMLFENIRVEMIGRIGQESQAVAIWDGTGLTIRDSFLQAGSISFLAGGAVTAVPNHVPADILIERCILTHPIEWRGRGYANKNSFELKNARRVKLIDSTLEFNYVDSQTGFAIQLTPTQSGSTASPETIVEDVEIRGNTIRNSSSGINAFGFTQQVQPTQKGHDYRIIGNTVVLSAALYGGNATFLQVAHESDQITVEDNIITTDGQAFLRAADSKPNTAFVFRGNVVTITGTYGIFGPLGSRGTRFNDMFPAGVIEANTFTGAHSIFRANFPNNVYQ